MLDYRLQVFHQVAQEQSLSRAARALHISQPAVTQHMKLLEEFLQTRLFQRSASGVTLSDSGILLLAHAQHVLQLHEGMMQRLRAKEGSVAGQLRLGCSTTVTQYYLPHILVKLKAKHPLVQIEVMEGNSDAVISNLLARRLDMGLIEAPCRRRDLRVQGFYDDEIIVIVPPKHRLAGRASVSLKELVEQSLIFRERGSGTRLSVEMEFKRQKVSLQDLHIVQELPSTEAIKRMVAAGSGLGFVSKLSVKEEINSGILAQLKVRGLKINRPFSALLPLGPDPIGLSQLLLGMLNLA